MVSILNFSDITNRINPSTTFPTYQKLMSRETLDDTDIAIISYFIEIFPKILEEKDGIYTAIPVLLFPIDTKKFHSIWNLNSLQSAMDFFMLTRKAIPSTHKNYDLIVKQTEKKIRELNAQKFFLLSKNKEKTLFFANNTRDLPILTPSEISNEMVLASGSFGEVQSAMISSNLGKVPSALTPFYLKKVAIKLPKLDGITSLPKEAQSAIYEEISIMMAFKSRKHVITALGMYQSNFIAGIVMPLMNQKDLFEFLKMPTIRLYIKELFIQSLRAVYEYHSLGWIHRDLKPENILIEMNNNNILLKLSDLATSLYVNHGKYTEKSLFPKGTTVFLDPKILDVLLECQKDSIEREFTYNEDTDRSALFLILIAILNPEQPDNKMFRVYNALPENQQSNENIRRVFITERDRHIESHIQEIYDDKIDQRFPELVTALEILQVSPAKNLGLDKVIEIAEKPLTLPPRPTASLSTITVPS